MISTIQTLVLLLVVISAVAVAARRLKVPPAILLVLTGSVLALIPGLPRLELAPEVALLVVLPPLIYASAVAMSWREFRFNLRPISLLAVGCVLFTTVAVAAASRWLLGLTWAVGFVLGAIVSPPDPVAPLAIARRLHLPRRMRDDAGSSANWICVSQMLPLSAPTNDGEAVGCHCSPTRFCTRAGNCFLSQELEDRAHDERCRGSGSRPRAEFHSAVAYRTQLYR